MDLWARVVAALNGIITLGKLVKALALLALVAGGAALVYFVIYVARLRLATPGRGISDLDGWMDRHLVRLPRNAELMARSRDPAVRAVGRTLATVPADDIRFYAMFRRLVTNPTHALVAREKNVVPLMAPPSIVKELVAAPGVVDDARLAAWTARRGVAVQSLIDAGAKVTLPADDDPLAVQAFHETDLLLVRYIDSIVDAYELRKSRGFKIQFVLLVRLLGDVGAYVMREVRLVWAAFGRTGWASAAKDANVVFSYYAAPAVQRLMVRLPGTVAGSIGKDPTKTLVDPNTVTADVAALPGA